jgi:hypothetical protein
VRAIITFHQGLHVFNLSHTHTYDETTKYHLNQTRFIAKRRKMKNNEIEIENLRKNQNQNQKTPKNKQTRPRPQSTG